MMAGCSQMEACRMSVMQCIVVGLFVVLGGTACRNPFLPPVGLPTQEYQARATPEGVVRQLIESYEKARIDLFEELLPGANEFQFFVAPSFAAVTKVNLPEEPQDTNLQYIGQVEKYYYWNQSAELEKTRRLFNGADQIVFSQKPTVEVRYFTGVQGRASAEVLLIGGELTISQKTGAYEITYHVAELVQQVLLLEQRDDDLWIIRKWYDLSTAPSSD